MLNSNQILTKIKNDFRTIHNYFNNEINSNYIDQLLNKLKNNKNELTPFEEMLRPVIENNEDDLDYESIQKLESNLKILLPIKEKKNLRFDKSYKKFIAENKYEKFWERYNELNVFAWFSNYGQIEELEWNKEHRKDKTSIDIKITINGKAIFCEVLSLSQKEIRKNYTRIEDSVCDVLLEIFGNNYFYRVDVSSTCNITESGLPKFIQEFKASFDEIFYKSTNITFKDYILDELKNRNCIHLPYPYATHYDSFGYTVSKTKDNITTISNPFWKFIFNKLEKDLQNKLFDKTKGKYKTFPKNEINLLLLYISRANEFLHLLPFNNSYDFDIPMSKFLRIFDKIYIKNNGLKKLSGFILMFPKVGDWGGEIIFFRNPHADKAMPFEIMNKLLDNNMTSYTIVHKEDIYINNLIKERFYDLDTT